MKKLTSKQISYLRGQAHHLNPVVIVGQHGVTEAVIREMETTLNHHELIKVQVRCDDQAELLGLMERITDGVKATLVQVIGHKAVLYRQSKDKKFTLPH